MTDDRRDPAADTASHSEVDKAEPAAAPAVQSSVEAAGSPSPEADDHVLTVDDVEIGFDDIEIRPVRERSIFLQLVKEETVRATVALLLLALFTMVVIFGFSHVDNWEEAKELLDLVLPAVTALLGSAVGFYFGTKSD